MFQKILISKKSLLGLERKELFCKSLYRNIQYPYLLSKAVRNLFSGLLERCKCQIVFPPVPNTVETPGFYSQPFSSKVQFLYNLLSSVALWGGPMVDTKGKIALEFRSGERSKMHFSWIFLWTFRVLSGILK